MTYVIFLGIFRTHNVLVYLDSLGNILFYFMRRDGEGWWWVYSSFSIFEGHRESLLITLNILEKNL